MLLARVITLFILSKSINSAFVLSEVLQKQWLFSTSIFSEAFVFPCKLDLRGSKATQTLLLSPPLLLHRGRSLQLVSHRVLHLQ